MLDIVYRSAFRKSVPQKWRFQRPSTLVIYVDNGICFSRVQSDYVNADAFLVSILCLCTMTVKQKLTNCWKFLHIYCRHRLTSAACVRIYYSYALWSYLGYFHNDGDSFCAEDVDYGWRLYDTLFYAQLTTQETQLMLTNGATRLEDNHGHQTRYHSICYVWSPISVLQYLCP